jgi:uncharacterized membrane protein YkvA (DUF1232 family)
MEEITVIVPFKKAFYIYFTVFLTISYIISPIDFFPDFAGVPGILDDAIAVYFLFATMKKAKNYGTSFFYKVKIFASFLTIFEITGIVYMFLR